jgi:ParB family transcriptional regulator, chromosome partitioning protein
MQLELSELDLRYAALRISDPSRRRRLLASLLEHGQQTPVLVVRDDTTWILIDGYVRVGALLELARDVVEVVVLEATEAEALVLVHGLDNSRERTALEEGWLLRELSERHGLARAELARRLDRTPSWVSRRLALVNTLPEVAQDAVRAGEVSVQAATKILVPLARANIADCEQLVRGLEGERMSVRQMHRLYVAWKESDEEVRERLCAQPRLFLRSLDAEPRVEPEDDEAAATLNDLSMLAGVCLRLCRRVREAGEPVTEPAREQRARAWRRAEGCFAALRGHFEREEKSDAGPRHPNGNLALGRRRPRHTNDRPDPEPVAGSGPQGPA